MIREADANETSGEDEFALLGSLVDDVQIRIPKFEPDIMLSNMLPLVCSVLGYMSSSSDGAGRKVISCTRAFGVYRRW